MLQRQHSDFLFAVQCSAVEIRPGVAVATLTGNLVVRDNSSLFNILENVEEEGKSTRAKQDRDSCETNAKVISPFLMLFCLYLSD